MKLIKQISSSIDKEQNVVAPDGWFTADEVHDAYIKGEQDGIEKGKRFTHDEFSKTLAYNLPLAASKAESLMSGLESKLGIVVPKAFLRIDGIAKFSSLLIVSKDDFLSDNMREAYIIADQLESEDGSFEICFSFTSQSEHLREEAIEADGYKLRHVKRRETT